MCFECCKVCRPRLAVALPPLTCRLTGLLRMFRRYHLWVSYDVIFHASMAYPSIFRQAAPAKCAVKPRLVLYPRRKYFSRRTV